LRRQQGGKPKIPFLLYTGLEKELDPKKLSQSGIDRVVKKTDSMRRFAAADPRNFCPTSPGEESGLALFVGKFSAVDK
jgi:hypothetical protein